MAAETLLSRLLGLLLLGLLLPASLTGCVGSLNLEELSEMRYGIEILPLPVMGGQSQASDVVIVSSKYKQRYECRLPAGAIHFQREREEETPAYQGPGIPELLSPMKDAPCLLKTKDWWTYEFCYGRHIQQYHMEDPAPGSPDDFQNNVQVKVIRSPADLIRLIEELKGGTKKGKPNAGQEQPADDAAEVPQREPEVKEKGDTEHHNEVEEEEDDEDEDEDEDERQLLGEFEKELEGILLPSDRERLRSEVKAGMERELENIIQETEKELDPDGLKKESERDRALLALTSTLNKLIKRLEEKQSPEVVKKHRRRRVVPRKPPLSPRPAGKIEIKIVRPGAEGTEEDARWLTDEDTKNLKEIFFNILMQGAEEAQKERQRQKDLESNYRRVWGSRGGEGMGDLDDFDF
ncbi:OS9 endoplasmic reticulum lectin [Rhinolophus ferrumequinum]|uniref:Endoplasmic reticulum lectin n=1 Tax=Rhinolophus ferrumequinum TaxID=59479 RepID=A0A671FHC4_RHIFE|nr:OS9 endoplasmic reticulum lectin [Rhinolophus ferrumequinum]